MPKQLKIIMDTGYTRFAPTTVNFSAPVIVEPGNRIALDKFTAIINSVTSNFALDDSTFTLYYSLNSPNFQSSNVSLPGAHYDTVYDLMTALTAVCNNAFTAYQVGILPITVPASTDRDLGLKVLCDVTTSAATATTNTFRMQYNTVAPTTLVLDQEGMTAGIGGILYPTGAGDWNVTNSTSGYLLRGGGCSLTFRFNMPTAVDAVANQSDWYIGLIGVTTGYYVGLHQNKTGNVYLTQEGVDGVEVDINNFPRSVVGGAQYYCQIYQTGGQFALRYYRKDTVNDEQVEVYNSNTTNPGALGSIDYTIDYTFQAEGESGPIVNANQTPGVFNSAVMTIDANPPISTGTFNRTMGFDMSTAGPLRAGLDVPPGLNLLNPQNSTFGSFLCQDSINMSIVNTAFDIAIEILDLPLQTYQASTQKIGERNNVVAYFHPELSGVGTSTYIYDSKSYQWLDIDVTYPINLASLSFRIYDPQTGKGLDALSLSFNLLIGTDSY